MVLTYNVQKITTTTTVNTSVDTLFVDPSQSTVNVTLPAISANGQRFLIKRTDSTGNSVFLLPNGSDTIGSSSTQSLSTGQVIELVSDLDNGNWEYFLNVSL